MDINQGDASLYLIDYYLKGFIEEKNSKITTTERYLPFLMKNSPAMQNLRLSPTYL